MFPLHVATKQDFIEYPDLGLAIDIARDPERLELDVSLEDIAYWMRVPKFVLMAHVPEQGD